jgi:hypothetical protein
MACRVGKIRGGPWPFLVFVGLMVIALLGASRVLSPDNLAYVQAQQANSMTMHMGP